MDTPRKHKRLKNLDQVFVKILQSTNEEKIKSGRTLLCVSKDVSVKGMCLEIPIDLPNGCRVELWAKSDKDKGTVRLVGRVVWVRYSEETSKSKIGIELVDKPGDDHLEFQKRVAKMLISSIKS